MSSNIAIFALGFGVLLTVGLGAALLLVDRFYSTLAPREVRVDESTTPTRLRRAS